jgi:hypothetical protein
MSELHKTGLSPAREMIRSSGSEVAGKELHMPWVERLLHHHRDHLISRSAPKIDRVREHVDSCDKYDSYLDMLHQKMEQSPVQRRLTFNMDEEGSEIGVDAPTKTVFSKMVWVRNGARGTSQDGSRVHDDHTNDLRRWDDVTHVDYLPQ